MIGSPPVRFRRPAGHAAAADARSAAGRSKPLCRCSIFRSRNDFVLVVAWLLATLRPGGPYPLLAISGEQGSAKTVLSKMLRALVDPNAAPVRALPREERELMIAANNGHVLAFDNLSALPPWLSDALCRLASGGSFAVRQLYTDDDEVLFRGGAPVMLNGIEDVVSRARFGRPRHFSDLGAHRGGSSGGPRASFGANSSSRVPASWAPCLTRPRWACATLPAFASHGCRGWPTSRSGPPPAKQRCGPPALLRAPMRQSQSRDRGHHRRRPGGCLRA